MQCDSFCRGCVALESVPQPRGLTGLRPSFPPWELHVATPGLCSGLEVTSNEFWSEGASGNRSLRALPPLLPASSFPAWLPVLLVPLLVPLLAVSGGSPVSPLLLSPARSLPLLVAVVALPIPSPFILVLRVAWIIGWSSRCTILGVGPQVSGALGSSLRPLGLLSRKIAEFQSGGSWMIPRPRHISWCATLHSRELLVMPGRPLPRLLSDPRLFRRETHPDVGCELAWLGGRRSLVRSQLQGLQVLGTSLPG